VSKDLKADVAAARKNWQTLAVMRTAWASSLKPLGACLLAVMLCAGLALPAHAITANTSVIPSAVTVTKETAYRGVFGGGAEAHTGLFGEDNPVNNSDPSGKAVYFVERHFQGFVNGMAWPLGYGHGYLMFTDPSDPGTGDPFWVRTRQQILHTFSWHPYSWNFDSHAQPGVPGRVWENDTAHDWNPGIRHNAVLVTTDAGQQSVLLNYINNWIATAQPGYDYGRPIPDKNDPGNTIGNPHVPAPAGGVFYSLRGQNCVWWSTVMLMDSGIHVPTSVYTEINQYNHGVGYASDVISGARSPNTFGTLSGRPLGINLSLPGYDLSGFDTGL
jgi:hypothetical protein